MSQYVVNIDDKAVTEQISGILDTIVKKELHRKYSCTGDVVAQAVKDIVYSHKDEIIEKCVARATAELIRRGVPKLLDRIGEMDTINITNSDNLTLNL